MGSLDATCLHGSRMFPLERVRQPPCHVSGALGALECCLQRLYARHHNAMRRQTLHASFARQSAPHLHDQARRALRYLCFGPCRPVLILGVLLWFIDSFTEGKEMSSNIL